MKQQDTPDPAEPVTEEPVPLPSCGWFQLPDIFDGGEGERCTSGKPATFRNCGMAVPVCEDHRCRCLQGAAESHDRLPVVLAQGAVTSALAELRALRKENAVLRAELSRHASDPACGVQFSVVLESGGADPEKTEVQR